MPVGAIALYLYDCVLPLYGNELLIVKGVGRWHIEEPGPFVLGGRRLALLDPLQPYAPTFRMVIDAPSLLVATEVTGDIQPMIDALLLHRVLCGVLAVLVVLGLPIVSLLVGPGIEMLAVFGSAYVVALTSGIFLWTRRQRLGLTSRYSLRLAIDGLLCPPLGVNLVRKLTLQVDVGNAASLVRNGPCITARPAFRVAARRLLLSSVFLGDPVAVEVERAVRLLDDDEVWR